MNLFCLNLFVGSISLFSIPFIMYILKDFDPIFLDTFMILSIIDVVLVGIYVIYLEIFSEVLKYKSFEKMNKCNILFFNKDLFLKEYVYKDSIFFMIPFVNIFYIIGSLKYSIGYYNKNFMRKWYIDTFVNSIKNDTSILRRENKSTLIKEALLDTYKDEYNVDEFVNMANNYFNLKKEIQEIEVQSRKDMDNRHELLSLKEKKISAFLNYLNIELQDTINNIQEKSLKLLNEVN